VVDKVVQGEVSLSNTSFSDFHKNWNLFLCAQYKATYPYPASIETCHKFTIHVLMFGSSSSHVLPFYLLVIRPVIIC
jgi:hypothetical protein